MGREKYKGPPHTHTHKFNGKQWAAKWAEKGENMESWGKRKQDSKAYLKKDTETTKKKV